MSDDTRQQRQARKELDRRLLAVEDPVEMKTEEGTEIVIAATPEEVAEDAAAYEQEVHHLGDTTAAEGMHRRPNVHIRGVGEVS